MLRRLALAAILQGSEKLALLLLGQFRMGLHGEPPMQKAPAQLRGEAIF
jgi:hypothetical protein